MIKTAVGGMTCTSCTRQVKEALGQVPGVNHAAASYTWSKGEGMADGGLDRDRMRAASAAPSYRPVAVEVAAEPGSDRMVATNNSASRLHIAVIGGGGRH
jgi:copper chaperone CopZ